MKPIAKAESFGATLRLARQLRKIGLRRFARMAGMTPTYLSKIERDQIKPRAEEIWAILQALLQIRDREEPTGWK